MIVSLRGTVQDIALDHTVIECNGVGYEVLASPNTLARLQRGEEAFVLTTMVVREDSQTLFGFLDAATRSMFSLLQTVSGLGPRLALATQAVYSTEDIASLIAAGDAKALQRVPGVGKRTAERMIVDLKDKVAQYAAEPSTPQSAPRGAAVAGPGSPLVHAQVLEALVGLGFAEKVAVPALEGVLAEQPDLNTSAALRATLSVLGSGK
ncbi:Holliday junction branch migration protein RuvA [Corynebacterium kozikiae]|uniref:Holliday junction branch migration protein RuvA n=1 Tax=Corynebacterium kozikiae TaxID=2968469 RepID=UPI00211D0372|nr:Holliday junction branch migration protein RuvA [Corynebacterium sp. 76QC2CO]MCQ9342510.1 Holliday junction branch migration protein RuvA [Corynebacterium sp. 76QC2CO]